MINFLRRFYLEIFSLICLFILDNIITLHAISLGITEKNPFLIDLYSYIGNWFVVLFLTKFLALIFIIFIPFTAFRFNIVRSRHVRHNFFILIGLYVFIIIANLWHINIFIGK